MSADVKKNVRVSEVFNQSCLIVSVPNLRGEWQNLAGERKKWKCKIFSKVTFLQKRHDNDSVLSDRKPFICSASTFSFVFFFGNHLRLLFRRKQRFSFQFLAYLNLFTFYFTILFYDLKQQYLAHECLVAYRQFTGIISN